MSDSKYFKFGFSPILRPEIVFIENGEREHQNVDLQAFANLLKQGCVKNSEFYCVYV